MLLIEVFHNLGISCSYWKEITLFFIYISQIVLGKTTTLPQLFLQLLSDMILLRKTSSGMCFVTCSLIFRKHILLDFNFLPNDVGM